MVYMEKIPQPQQKPFKKNNGLTEDGYAGKDTINKMLTEDVKKANTTETPITETDKEQKKIKTREP